MTQQKATQWANWWAQQAEALRSRAIGYLTATERRTAIEQAQFMAAYWTDRAQEANA